MTPQNAYSVIIPTYNRACLLLEAIDSVRSQNHPSLEIIVVDDGSTDHTKEVVNTLGANIIYCYQKNAGPGAARNRGLEIAKGDFISFLDSDDLFLTGKIAKEQERFKQYPQTEILITDAVKYEEGEIMDHSWFGSKNLKLSDNLPVFMDASNPLWINNSLFPTSSTTFRRSILNKLGIKLYDLQFKRGEDWDLEIRMLRECKVLVDATITTHIRRFDDGSIRVRIPGQHEYVLTKEVYQQRHDILQKAFQMGNWTPEIKRHIRMKMDELEAKILK